MSPAGSGQTDRGFDGAAGARECWYLGEGRHSFLVLKRQFAHPKVRTGLAKNTAQLQTLFALANLWLARRKLLAALA